MHFISVNGLAHHCVLSGNQNGVPLVFINSLGTDLRIWDDVAANFAAEYRLIRYDKRGHGLSDCPPAPYTIRDHAADLAAFLDQLDTPPAILVGISVGGMIAQDFAATWPERVRALVLCDTAVQIGTAVLWNDRINTLRQHGMASLAESILSRWFAPGFADRSPTAYRGYKNMLTRTPVEGYTGTCAAIRDADLTYAARTIQQPSLVLCGAEDTATTPEMACALAAAMPNAVFKEIPGAGHLPCIEQPQAMATLIESFLRKLS